MTGIPAIHGGLLTHSDSLPEPRAITEAACAPIKPPKVKPLEWRPNKSTHLDCQYVDSFGLFQLALENGVTLLWESHSSHCSEFQTLEAAKAAAQSIYEARVLSALEATP